MIRKLRCVSCGRDITRAYKFYIDNLPYCYDCSEEYKRLKKLERVDSLSVMINEDYYKGKLKPSELAEKYHLPVAEIYKRLTNEHIR